MALIVEDGSGVPNAQTFATAAEVRTYATARGIVVPADDVPGNAEIEAALVNAMDYLSISVCFGGKPTESTQPLPFPRKCLRVNGDLIEDDVIPGSIKTAQIRLALAVLSGIDLMPNVSGNAIDFVVKEKVGPIETEYADPLQYDGTATLTAIDALLEPFCGGCPSGASFTVFRA